MGPESDPLPPLDYDAIHAAYDESVRLTHIATVMAQGVLEPETTPEFPCEPSIEAIAAYFGCDRGDLHFRFTHTLDYLTRTAWPRRN